MHRFHEGLSIREQQQFVMACQHANPSELKDLLDRIEYFRDGIQHAFASIALKRWLEVDASGALAYANQRGGQWPGLCMLQWAEVDLPAAIKAVLESPSANSQTNSRRFQSELGRNVRGLLLLKVAESDPLAALELSDKMPLTGAEAHRAYNIIFQRLSAKDPSIAASTLDAVKDRNARQIAMTQITTEWGKRDPEAALAWLRKQPASAMGLFSLGNAWATHDPQAVLARLDELSEYPGSRATLLGTALATWWEDDPTAMQIWLTDADLNEKTAQRVQANLITKVAASDPESAAILNSQAVAQGHPSQEHVIFQSWAEEDPHGVLDWASAQPKGAPRDDGMLAAISVLSKRDPVAMLEELPLLAETIDYSGDWWKMEIAGPLMKVLSARGQKASEDWIKSLPPPIGREFLEAYTGQWQFRAPSETLAFLLEQPLSDDLVSTAQGVLSAKLAREDPAAAAEIVTAFEDQQMREIGTQNVMSSWLSIDPNSAEEWTLTLTDAPTRDSALAMLANHAAEQNLDKAFAFAKQLADPYERHDVVRQLLQRVHDQDTATIYVDQANLLEADRAALLSGWRFRTKSP